MVKYHRRNRGSREIHYKNVSNPDMLPINSTSKNHSVKNNTNLNLKMIASTKENYSSISLININNVQNNYYEAESNSN